MGLSNISVRFFCENRRFFALFVAISGIFTMLSASVGSAAVGRLVVFSSFRMGWIAVAAVGVVLILLQFIYIGLDKMITSRSSSGRWTWKVRKPR